VVAGSGEGLEHPSHHVGRGSLRTMLGEGAVGETSGVEEPSPVDVVAWYGSRQAGPPSGPWQLDSRSLLRHPLRPTTSSRRHSQVATSVCKPGTSKTPHLRHRRLDGRGAMQGGRRVVYLTGPIRMIRGKKVRG